MASNETGPAVAKCPDFRGQALVAAWCILHETGDPGAEELLVEARQRATSAPSLMDEVKRALPAWCEAHALRAELCGLLAKKFQEQFDPSEEAVESIIERLKALCLHFAVAKYSDNAVAREFARVLAYVAQGQLDLPQLPTARAAHTVFAEREKLARQRQADSIQMIELAERLNLPATLKNQIGSSTYDGDDAILGLLRRFLSKDDNYWTRFFDRRGRERRKKLPNLPSMRERLVRRLLDPGSLGPYPQGCGVGRAEAYELAAKCIKAAFPKKFPASLDGESIRLAMQYHEQMKSRPTEQRPRYEKI